MTAALTLPSLRSFWFALAGLSVALALFCGVAIQQAQAASLTGAQVTAVINLLQSFNVDSATLQNVESALNGQAQPGTANTPSGSVASSASSTPTVPTTATPVLSSVSPSSGAVGTSVTLSGSGFLASGNTIFFGGAVAASNVQAVALPMPQYVCGVGSANCVNPVQQYSLTFTVPASLEPYCQAGSSCPQYVLTTTPGTYQVSVIDANGSSNSLQFTVTASAPLLPVATSTPPINPVTSTTTSVTSQPVVTFTAWPSSGTAPLTVYLTLTGASSPSGYSINFGDGASGSSWTADNETANTFFMAHTYTAAGTYRPSVSNGSQTYSASVVITGATPPPAPVVVPSSPIPGGSGSGGGTANGSGPMGFLSDPSDALAAVAMAPFSLMVQSLTNIFVQFGIGQ